MTNKAYQATPRHVLEHQIMSHGEGKNEREWWACHEIEKLRARIAVLEAECENTSRYANKLEDVLRRINLASLKPNGSKEECGVIAREAINGHI